MYYLNQNNEPELSHDLPSNWQLVGARRDLLRTVIQTPDDGKAMVLTRFNGLIEDLLRFSGPMFTTRLMILSMDESRFSESQIHACYTYREAMATHRAIVSETLVDGSLCGHGNLAITLTHERDLNHSFTWGDPEEIESWQFFYTRSGWIVEEVYG